MAEEKRNVMTEEGMRKLQEQLDFLVGTRRNEIAHQIEVARGFGDLSENAEYTEAKNDQAKLEEEITRITNLIRTAVVVADSEISTDKVSVGVSVVLLDTELDEEVTYAIVGAEEADPWENKISNESPVGAALLGTVLDFAAFQGVQKVWLEVRESNTAARKLYEKVGFAAVGKREKYYSAPVEDAVMMMKELELC